MKRVLLVLALFMLLGTACSTSNDNNETPARQSENRCGDDVCDGPENINNCAEDCSSSGISQNAPEDDLKENQEDENSSEPPLNENPSGRSMGFIIVNLIYDQEAIEGNCGSDAWAVEGGFPPCYWWGEYYEVAMTQMLILSENSNGTWGIQPQNTGNGYYQEAKTWDDDQRCCSPTLVQGENFEFNTDGNYENGAISFSFSANPVYYWEFENRPDNCPGAQLVCPAMNGSASHSRLLYAWADAMNGNYQDLSTNLYATGEMGIYRNEFSATSNPIPSDSVNIRIAIEFQCISPDQNYNSNNIYETTTCPWE